MSEYPIRTAEVCRMVGGIDRTTLWRWQRERGFPKPCAKPSPKVNLYDPAEVRDWLARQDGAQQ